MKMTLALASRGRMGLRYAVVTSVNRDDQPDGGAHIFAPPSKRFVEAFPAAKSKC